jgi:hypothetical protein
VISRVIATNTVVAVTVDNDKRQGQFKEEAKVGKVRSNKGTHPRQESATSWDGFQPNPLPSYQVKCQPLIIPAWYQALLQPTF